MSADLLQAEERVLDAVVEDLVIDRVDPAQLRGVDPVQGIQECRVEDDLFLNAGGAEVGYLVVEVVGEPRVERLIYDYLRTGLC